MDTTTPSLRSTAAAVVLVLAAAVAVVAVAPAPAQAASCAGFTNRAGMTNKVIRIGNASDLSGPVPNLYRDAQLATKAYVAYFNSARTICGRKLALTSVDTRTDDATNLSAYRTLCTQTFASVGSMSLYDGGGAGATQSCRLPDLRVTAATNARNACTTCFSVNAVRAGEAPNSVPDYFVAQRPAAVQKAAMVYLNLPALAARAITLQKVASARGYSFLSTQAIDIADFSYGPYVTKLKNDGVRAVQFVGPYQQTVRWAQAMQTANFTPDVFLVEPGSYVPGYASAGGSAVQNSVVPINFVPLSANQAELNLYRSWLAKVSPGATPTPTGLFAWSAAKLFTSQAISLGGKLSRASLNARLRTVTAWTGGGLHPPMQVGTKHVSPCTRLLALKSGRWVSIGGTSYRCTGVTTAP
ncbi:MAG: ABC transporter substrate-binding protein [Propionibacteriales bacterium]|nr:ABC transporter substrate-binding protein [Propionibacteriales bacterium]